MKTKTKLFGHSSTKMYKTKTKKKTVRKKTAEQKTITKSSKPDLIVLKHNIEAILFAAGKSLELKFIADLCSSIEFQTKKQLLALQEDYSTNSVLMIMNQDTTWKMTVREQYLDVVIKIVADTELSKSQLETLSMIAFRSPALQSDVVKARGIVTYDHVAELVRLGFVVKQRIGRSYILKLTEKFYEYFEIDGTKIKEVFQPVKDRVDEQLLLGDMKIVNAKADVPRQKEIFERTQEERLGELEVIRIENQQKAEKINSVKDSHRDFLDSVDNEIVAISQRTDVEEKEIDSIRTSEVQDKINSIKSDESGEDQIVTGESESSTEQEENKTMNASEMLEETEHEIEELTEKVEAEENKKEE